MSVRPVKEIIHPKPTLEGAGVRLQRGFGFGNTTEFDPFLLFDDFRNERPEVAKRNDGDAANRCSAGHVERDDPEQLQRVLRRRHVSSPAGREATSLP